MEYTAEELFQSFVDASYDELLTKAKDSLDALTGFFKTLDEKATAEIMMHIVATTVAADGEFTEAEYKFLCDLLSLQSTYEQVKTYIERYRDEGSRALLDLLYDAYFEHDDIRYHLTVLIVGIMAADETISAKEVALAFRLFRQ